VDSFSYGKPARGGLAPTKLVGAIGAVVLVGAVAFALFQVTKSGGEAVVKKVKQDVQQIDKAGDTEAQASLATALVTAQTTYMDGASFAGADANGLAAAEPSLRYASGPSTAANVVSVTATATDWGAAVLSRSGTCYYVHASGAGGTFYGSGKVCTGQAALAASGASW